MSLVRSPWARKVVFRALGAIPLLLAVAFIMFALMSLAPGDAAARIAGEGASLETIERIRETLGLDQPLLVRFGDWVSAALTGDLGTSLYSGQEVTPGLLSRVPVTVSLLAVSLSFALLVGFTVGILAALKPGSVIDRAATGVAAALAAAPPFWIGLLLVLFLAVQRPWFPALGYAGLDQGVWTWLRHLALPSLALAAIPAAEVARQLRASLRDVTETDYWLAARAKGIRRRLLFGKHGLKNAALPVVTVFGFRAAQAVGATVVVERVFSIDGLGSLMVRSVLQRDIPVVLGATLFATLLVIVVNLLVDLSYGYFSPRSVDG